MYNVIHKNHNFMTS